MKTKCVFCGLKTSKVLEDYVDEYNEPIICCEPCLAKYDTKISDKLYDLDIRFKLVNEVEDKEEKPFKATISLEGGNKQDIINVIVSMMDANDVTLEEVEANQY